MADDRLNLSTESGWRQLGNDVAQALRGVASWIGAEGLVDDLAAYTKGKSVQDYINQSTDQISAVNRLLNKIASDYNINMTDLQNQLSSLSGIPLSTITGKARSQQKSKIEKRMREEESKYGSIKTELDKIQNLAMSQLNKNATQRASYANEKLDKTLSNKISNIERRLNSNV